MRVMIFVFAALILTSLGCAEFGYNNLDGPILGPDPTFFDNSTALVNASEFWNTISLGPLNDVDPTQFESNNGQLGIIGAFNESKFTAGSVLFSNGTDIVENNANFFWDTTDLTLTISDLILSSSGTNNVFIGDSVGNYSGVGVGENVAIGTSILSVANDADKNVAIGYNIMNTATSPGSNVGIGNSVLRDITTGGTNVALGSGAAAALTTGFNNFALGHQTLKTATTANSNVAIGPYVLNKQTLSQAIGIGAYTGQSIVGNYNVLIGGHAGRGASGASNVQGNVFIGYKSGNTIRTGGSDNVFIGHYSGSRITTTGDLLIIDNQDRGNETHEINESLIYGTFDNDPANQWIRINGDLKLSADNRKLYFGELEDVSHTMDGANYNITNEVGNIPFNFNNFSEYNFDNNVSINVDGMPQSILHINGGVGSMATGLTFGDGDSGIYEHVDDTIILRTPKGVHVRTHAFDNNAPGIWGGSFNSDVWVLKNSAVAIEPAYTFYFDYDTGMGRGDANELILYAGGDRVKLTSTGLHLVDDGEKIYWGAADDVSSTMDGTNFNITNEVGNILFKFLNFSKYLFDNDVEINGDLNQTDGNFTGNNIYAEAWGKDIGDIAIGNASQYYPVTNMTVGLVNGMSGNSENLTVLIAGVYSLTAHWSFSGQANNEYHISIEVNGVQQDKCHAERKIGTGGDVGSASFTCLYSYSVGDKIRMVIENVDAGNNATIHNINANMVRIGN